MSPDGETIVTGAGDETLRFWNAFPSKKEREKIGIIGNGAGNVVGEWVSKGRESALDYGRLIR